MSYTDIKVVRVGKKWVVMVGGHLLEQFNSQRDAEVYTARVKGDMFKFGKELAKKS